MKISSRFVATFLYIVMLLVICSPHSVAQIVFATTGNLTTPRWEHTSTVLQDSTVLIAGGINSTTTTTATAERYTPSSGNGTSAATGSMTMARSLHTATLLNNGMVLIVGGQAAGNSTTAELYNPISGTFKVTGSLKVPRGGGHTATLLGNGKVLIAGGNYINGAYAETNSAELYDPATGIFTITGAVCGSRRSFHTATLLSNGQVLIGGGVERYKQDITRNIWTTVLLSSACLYNPSSGTSVSTGNLNAPRSNHSATLLRDGTVLMASGNGGNSSLAEIYNPTTGTFSYTGSLNTWRTGHAAVLLNDGTVLIMGGSNPNTQAPLTSAELYNPPSGKFTAIGSLNTARLSPTATLLVGGAVLVAGGYSASSPLASSENYLSGMVYPKYVVLGVTYAPPGSASNVNYTNTTAFGSSSNLSNSFTQTNKFSTSVGYKTALFGVLPGGSVTGTFSTNWSNESDSSSSYTVNQTTANGTIVYGPTSSAVGLDHDADVVWIWLNPVTTFTELAPKNLDWTGFSYDMRDPLGRMDVYGVYMSYLNGDAAIPPNVASVLARSWAPNLVDGSGPGLTSNDLMTIAEADPFWQCVPNPSSCPTTVDSTRFSPNSSTNIQYEPPSVGNPPITQTGSITIQTTLGQGQGGQDQRSVGYAIDAKANGGWLGGFNIDIGFSQDFAWMNKWSTMSTQTVGQAASFSVTGPAYTDNYKGPTRFNVYQDTVYGTFMFFPCAGGSC